MKNNIKCILFDLDGTLLDTSFDFAHALNKVLTTANKKPLLYSSIRQTISDGAMAMTKLAFPELSNIALQEKYNEFISVYQQNIALHSQLFPTLNIALQHLEQHKIPWGIVTNKPKYLVDSLLKLINFSFRPNCVVCGDRLSVRKPNPEPLIIAAEECKTPVQQCLYIGDHPRDIEAGINANMQTASALFGFVPMNELANDMLNKADYSFYSPNEVTKFIQNIR